MTGWGDYERRAPITPMDTIHEASESRYSTRVHPNRSASSSSTSFHWSDDDVPLDNEKWIRPGSERQNAKELYKVVALGLVLVGIILTAVLVPLSVLGLLPHQRQGGFTAPTAAPTPLPNSVYASSTPFVYAVGAYSDSVYLAARWDAAGTVHHPSDAYELYETIEACPSTSICTLLILVNATHVVGPSMRFDGFHIQRVYTNETHVVVMGVGPSIANTGWEIPGSEGVTIERGHTGRAGAIIVYSRDLITGLLTYIHSALIIQPVNYMAGIRMNKGDMTMGRVFASFDGSCFDGESWAFTPMSVEHTSDVNDVSLACSRYQAVAMVYEGSTLKTVWQVEATTETTSPVVHIAYTGGEGAHYIVVYGVYGSDADGLAAEEFQIPLFSSTPTPGGNVPGVASPPGPSIPWTSVWSAGFLIRYDATTYELVDYVRHEVASNNIDFSFDGNFALCGETVTFTTVHLYEFATSGMPENGTFTDPDENTLSPFCCQWSFAGDLSYCQLYKGTAEAVITSVSDSIFTAYMPGTVQRSDYITIASPDVTYVTESVYNMTLPVDGVFSQSNYNGNFDDGSLVYDGVGRYGEYIHTPGQTRLWYAIEGGIQVYVD